MKGTIPTQQKTEQRHNNSQSQSQGQSSWFLKKNAVEILQKIANIASKHHVPDALEFKASEEGKILIKTLSVFNDYSKFNYAVSTNFWKAVQRFNDNITQLDLLTQQPLTAPVLINAKSFLDMAIQNSLYNVYLNVNKVSETFDSNEIYAKQVLKQLFDLTGIFDNNLEADINNDASNFNNLNLNDDIDFTGNVDANTSVNALNFNNLNLNNIPFIDLAGAEGDNNSN